ncbi:4-phosphopantetheinyl transferase [Paracoccus halophilus]|uniref:Enterobactin synthase component D n=1 Tax=Paracoccus halophilus TaxID=376733 RepID=A0A099EZW8_9RHOB|nr:4-phosphopantetheinyl transferase [Paracoccus halophilus]
MRDLALRLLPQGYGCAVQPLSAAATPLLPEESAAVARAVPKRQREFAVGRMVLRAAIREAGHALPADRPIAARPDRLPDLPRQIRASLSHGGDHCIAIAAPPGGASVGIDLEPISRALPEGLAEMVAPFRLTAVPDDPLLVFSIKEALFKAQYPLTGRMLDFSDVPVAIRDHRFRACLGNRLIGGLWGRAMGYYLSVSLCYG